MLHIEWDGVNAADYDAARKLVNCEGDVAPGGIMQVMAVTDTGIRITDVWKPAEDFQAFVRDRLMPGVKEVGIAPEPRVVVHPVHALFVPGFEDE